MNTEKIKTLEQVHDAFDVVEEARSGSDLSQTERIELEKASVQLRNLERNIIKAKTNEMINALTSDTEALKKLAKEISEMANKLKVIASVIEKAAKVVEIFVHVASTAASAGLL
jgi:hypothetical protein